MITKRHVELANASRRSRGGYYPHEKMPQIRRNNFGRTLAEMAEQGYAGTAVKNLADPRVLSP
jgi:hypothetical protein